MILSIVIPMYNSSLKLERLLKSIPENKEIEIIVIDDKSEEKLTKYIIEKIKEKKIKYYYNKGKKGAGSSRNIGILKAKGDWILFADSDDYFLENFFEVIKKFMNSNYDLIYFKSISIYENNNQEAERHKILNRLIDNYIKKRNIQSEKRLKYEFIVPWSKLIKRKKILQYEIFFDEIIASNDVLFSIKLGYFFKKIMVSEEVIYCATTSKGSLTQTKTEEIFDARFLTILKVNKFLREKKEGEFQYSCAKFILGSFDYGPKKFLEVIKLSIAYKNNIFIGYKKWIFTYFLRKKIEFKEKEYVLKKG